MKKIKNISYYFIYFILGLSGFIIIDKVFKDNKSNNIIDDRNVENNNSKIEIHKL